MVEDYGTLLRRFTVIVVDSTILSIFAVLIAWLWSFFAEIPNIDIAFEHGWLAFSIEHGWLVFLIFGPKYFLFCTAAFWLYLAVIKRTDIRTFGYRAAGLRVVDLKGKRPSLLKMTWRFVLLVFGPFHLLVDFFWLGGDENRQTLRDKLARTYVVKAKAQPAGSGTIQFVKYYFWGYAFLFPEVKKQKEE